MSTKFISRPGGWLMIRALMALIVAATVLITVPSQAARAHSVTGCSENTSQYELRWAQQLSGIEGAETSGIAVSDSGDLLLVDDRNGGGMFRYRAPNLADPGSIEFVGALQLASASGRAVDDLEGAAWIDDNRFVAVSEQGSSLHWFELPASPPGGQSEIDASESRPIGGAGPFTEGIGFNPTNGGSYATIRQGVKDQVAPAIYDLTSGFSLSNERLIDDLMHNVSGLHVSRVNGNHTVISNDETAVFGVDGVGDLNWCIPLRRISGEGYMEGVTATADDRWLLTASEGGVVRAFERTVAPVEGDYTIIELPAQIKVGDNPSLTLSSIAKDPATKVTFSVTAPDGSSTTVGTSYSASRVKVDNVWTWQWTVPPAPSPFLTPGDHIVKTVVTERGGAHVETTKTVAVDGDPIAINEYTIIGVPVELQQDDNPSLTLSSIAKDPATKVTFLVTAPDGSSTTVGTSYSASRVKVDNVWTWQWTVAPASSPFADPGSYDIEAIATEKDGTEIVADQVVSVDGDPPEPTGEQVVVDPCGFRSFRDLGGNGGCLSLATTFGADDGDLTIGEPYAAPATGLCQVDDAQATLQQLVDAHTNVRLPPCVIRLRSTVVVPSYTTLTGSVDQHGEVSTLRFEFAAGSGSPHGLAVVNAEKVVIRGLRLTSCSTALVDGYVSTCTAENRDGRLVQNPNLITIIYSSDVLIEQNIFEQNALELVLQYCTQNPNPNPDTECSGHPPGAAGDEWALNHLGLRSIISSRYIEGVTVRYNRMNGSFWHGFETKDCNYGDANATVTGCTTGANDGISGSWAGPIATSTTAGCTKLANADPGASCTADRPQGSYLPADHCGGNSSGLLGPVCSRNVAAYSNEISDNGSGNLVLHVIDQEIAGNKLTRAYGGAFKASDGQNIYFHHNAVSELGGTDVLPLNQRLTPRTSHFYLYGIVRCDTAAPCDPTGLGVVDEESGDYLLSPPADIFMWSNRFDGPVLGEVGFQIFEIADPSELQILDNDWDLKVDYQRSSGGWGGITVCEGSTEVASGGPFESIPVPADRLSESECTQRIAQLESGGYPF